MKGVLSDNALEEYNRNGFVRTGLHLEPATVQTIRAQYRAMPATASNWSYFMLKDLSHYAEGGWGEFIANIQRKLKARKIHRQIRNTVYGKSIYGTSDIVSEILEECVEGGLASFFPKSRSLSGMTSISKVIRVIRLSVTTKMAMDGKSSFRPRMT